MKGLLHSKLFKKNLFRWLFMYITVIGLFTSVVTYSKYISNIQNGSKAKPASFDAAITYDGVCSGVNEGEICDNGDFRPFSEISYYFTVDTTGLEVSTLFVTRISVSPKFKEIKIYDITDTKTDVTEKFVENNNIFSRTENLKTDQTYIRKYEVIMNYDYATYNSEYKLSDELEAVTVGYSATQQK